MIIQPLFFEWPNIPHFYHDDILDSTFLIGKNIICIPIVNENSNYTIGFFPNDSFYNFKTGDKNIENFLFLLIPLNESLPLFIRAGSIIHFQDAENVQSTEYLNNCFKLFVVLKENQALGFFIGYEEYSEENIAECIHNDYECIWEIKCYLEIKKIYDFKIILEFFSNNKTKKNLGRIKIEEIHLIGLQEDLKQMFYGFEKIKLVLENEEKEVKIEKEVNIEVEKQKVIIKCEFFKNLNENEKILIFYEIEDEASFCSILILLIFFIFIQILFLCF